MEINITTNTSNSDRLFFKIIRNKVIFFKILSLLKSNLCEENYKQHYFLAQYQFNRINRFNNNININSNNNSKLVLDYQYSSNKHSYWLHCSDSQEYKIRTRQFILSNYDSINNVLYMLENGKIALLHDKIKTYSTNDTELVFDNDSLDLLIKLINCDGNGEMEGHQFYNDLFNNIPTLIKDYNLLVPACKYNNFYLVKLLFENYYSKVNVGDMPPWYCNNSLIDIAILHGNLEMVKYLLGITTHRQTFKKTSALKSVLLNQTKQMRNEMVRYLINNTNLIQELSNQLSVSEPPLRLDKGILIEVIDLFDLDLDLIEIITFNISKIIIPFHQVNQLLLLKIHQLIENTLFDNQRSISNFLLFFNKLKFIFIHYFKEEYFNIKEEEYGNELNKMNESTSTLQEYYKLFLFKLLPKLNKEFWNYSNVNYKNCIFKYLIIFNLDANQEISSDIKLELDKSISLMDLTTCCQYSNFNLLYYLVTNFTRFSEITAGSSVENTMILTNCLKSSNNNGTEFNLILQKEFIISILNSNIPNDILSISIIESLILNLLNLMYLNLINNDNGDDIEDIKESTPQSNLVQLLNSIINNCNGGIKKQLFYSINLIKWSVDFCSFDLFKWSLENGWSISKKQDHFSVIAKEKSGNFIKYLIKENKIETTNITTLLNLSFSFKSYKNYIYLLKYYQKYKDFINCGDTIIAFQKPNIKSISSDEKSSYSFLKYLSNNNNDDQGVSGNVTNEISIERSIKCGDFIHVIKHVSNTTIIISDTSIPLISRELCKIGSWELLSLFIDQLEIRFNDTPSTPSSKLFEYHKIILSNLILFQHLPCIKSFFERLKFNFNIFPTSITYKTNNPLSPLTLSIFDKQIQELIEHTYLSLFLKSYKLFHFFIFIVKVPIKKNHLYDRISTFRGKNLNSIKPFIDNLYIQKILK